VFCKFNSGTLKEVNMDFTEAAITNNSQSIDRVSRSHSSNGSRGIN
jgi:hypothetical protein